MSGILDVFDTSGFMPRWQCGIWSLKLGLLHVVSDLAIFGAYTAIPLVIAYFVLRRKSWSTVVALALITPKALRLPGLARLNDELMREIKERRKTEEERDDLLTREQAARSEAERANRIKDEFLSVVSHELRTPLTAILGYVQLLRAGFVQPEKVPASLDAIRRNCQTQVQIIEDLLDISRIIAGNVRLDLRSVSLTEVVEAAVNTIRPLAEAKSLRLQTELDPQAGPVLGDFDRLQQVLINLLSNAVKFTPEKGSILVSLERVSAHLEISVKDTGRGIDPELLPYVFDRFWQAEGTSGGRYTGLGIGLAIVKQIVELHGGSVRAKSPGPLRGATLTIALPRQILDDQNGGRMTPRAEVAPTEFGRLPDLSGLRVLVVDDEPDGRDVIAQILATRGAETAAASSADEAIRVLRSFKPDVLLSDIRMPGKDGYQLLQEIHSLEADEGRNVPAIALTGFARAEDRKLALLTGYRFHLAKPFDPGELIVAVAMLAGRTG
ncbi:MAG: hybrid sensor histidine kinase/response regulator [Acidobacteria bacterium]|nr:MAG: hybrid sensor histidine kinase/response regulator [Acidobacteriota bacterium]